MDSMESQAKRAHSTSPTMASFCFLINWNGQIDQTLLIHKCLSRQTGLSLDKQTEVAYVPSLPLTFVTVVLNIPTILSQHMTKLYG